MNIFKVKYLPVIVIFLSFTIPFSLSLLFSTKGLSVQSSAGFATLVLDESVSDSEVRKRLGDHGIDGSFSEAAQWAFVNTFDGLEKVSLDQYSERVLDFDPRNDGYAQKVKNIFVNNGKRFVFIPVSELGLAGVQGGGDFAHRKIENALGEIPFSGLIFKSAKQDNSIFYLFFVIVCAICLYKAAFVDIHFRNNPNVQRKTALQTRRGRENIIVLLCTMPALSILILGGAAGFAICAIFMAIFQFYDPLVRWFAENYGKNTVHPYLSVDRQVQKRDIEYLTGEKPEKHITRLALMLIIIFAASIAGGINIVQIIITALIFFSSWLAIRITFEQKRAHEAVTASLHKAFVCVPIKAGRKQKKPMLYIPIIFSVFAFAVYFITLIFFSSSTAQINHDFMPDAKKNLLVSEADYLKHIRFQQDFAYNDLNSRVDNGGIVENQPPDMNYLHYTIDDKGLFGEGSSVNEQRLNISTTVEPFNLTKLLEFLQSDDIITKPQVGLWELFPLVITLLLYAIIAIYKRTKKENMLELLFNRKIV
ncbi:MAG: hypothetical protein Ta2B_29120 [Termitinemataceae bacterium]|nr:MAG: hypothetical protein Ta2B_29120 [Termitinemataceae bacterium]